MTGALWTSALVCLLFGSTLPLIIKPWLHRQGVVDRPSSRSSHAVPTVRGGGLGVWAAMVLGLVIYLPFSDPPGVVALYIVVLSSTAAVALGWLEDSVGIPIVARAGLQVTIAALTGISLLILLEAPLWLVPLITIGMAAYINIANFMDGVNGISAFHAVVVGAVFVAAGAGYGRGWLVVCGLVLAVAFATFVPWNFLGSRLFLGDAGSYLLGAFIAATAGAAFIAGIPLLVLVGPLCIYLADTVVTLAIRALSGARWYESHRSHFYHQLEDAGMPHLAVGAVVAMGSATTGALGLATAFGPMLEPAFALAFIGVVVALYLLLPTTLRFRFQSRVDARADSHHG